jgi:hypothetical protein
MEGGGAEDFKTERRGIFLLCFDLSSGDSVAKYFKNSTELQAT